MNATKTLIAIIVALTLAACGNADNVHLTNIEASLLPKCEQLIKQDWPAGAAAVFRVPHRQAVDALMYDLADNANLKLAQNAGFCTIREGQITFAISNQRVLVNR